METAIPNRWFGVKFNKVERPPVNTDDIIVGSTCLSNVAASAFDKSNDIH
jgi:hypothetical protein